MPAEVPVPVRVLSDLFRGKFLDGLADAYERGELKLEDACAVLADPEGFNQLKDTVYRKNWEVYTKRPFAGPEQVFKYLGRYTHRVGISNHRLVSFDGLHASSNIRTKLAEARRQLEANDKSAQASSPQQEWKETPRVDQYRLGDMSPLRRSDGQPCSRPSFVERSLSITHGSGQLVTIRARNTVAPIKPPSPAVMATDPHSVDPA